MVVAGPHQGGLTTTRTLFICSLHWELTREHGVDGSLGYAYTNSARGVHSLYPSGQLILAFYTKCGCLRDGLNMSAIRY